MTKTAANQRTEFLTYSHVIGIANMEGRGFYFPSDTAIGIDGRFYTVNRSVEGDTRGVRVTVYDIDGGFFGTFGSFGEEPGSFISPTSIAVDRDGLVYIGDDAPAVLATIGEHGLRVIGVDRLTHFGALPELLAAPATLPPP